MKKVISLILVLSLMFVFAASISANTINVQGFDVTTEIRNNRSQSFHRVQGEYGSSPYVDSAKMWYRISSSNVLYVKNVYGRTDSLRWEANCYVPNGYIVDHANTVFRGVTVTAW